MIWLWGGGTGSVGEGAGVGTPAPVLVLGDDSVAFGSGPEAHQHSMGVNHPPQGISLAQMAHAKHEHRPSAEASLG